MVMKWQPAALAATILAGLACPATEPETTILPSQPAWMEWPADVRADLAFSVRMVGYYPGCYPRQELRIGVQRFDADIVFRTEWLVDGPNDVLCLGDPGLYDTLVTVAGLPAIADSAYDLLAVVAESGALRRMGAVRARSSAALSNNTAAGGVAVGSTDIEGCAVMQRNFDAPVPVENPPAASWLGFVSGYFFTPETPLCGQTRVYHIEAGP
jgi:hypothetical protein